MKKPQLLHYMTDGFLAALITSTILVIASLIVSYDFSVEWHILDVLGFALATLSMITLPTLVMGLTMGLILGLWKAEIQGKDAVHEDQALSARIAAAMILIPTTGAVVGLLHLLVTSKFVRPTFQALGLVLLTTFVGVLLLGLSPLVTSVTTWVLSKIGLKSEKYLLGTQKLIFILAVLYVLGTLAGCFYLTTLNLWPLTLIVMLATVFLGVPGLMFLLYFKRPKWLKNQPLVATLTLIVLGIIFGFSGAILSASVANRQWIRETPSLISLEARILRNLNDQDHDGFAATWGGNDCNDQDDSIYPGAFDEPGDGIDQSCSGKDAQLIIDPIAPAQTIIWRSISRATSTVQQLAQNRPNPPKNIMVILVDTLRMDHTGFGGYHKDTTPSLDALAAKSAVFKKAYATSPHTPRSIPAIFLSRYASKTKWKGAQYNYPRVLPENLSFFEVLKDNGYQTYGFSSHHYFQEKRGLNQGFDTWDNEGFKSIADSNDDIAAPRVWAKVEPMLDKLGAQQQDKNAIPFAMFVHYFEPHARWINHNEYQFDHDDTTESKHKASYDSEVRFVDDYVGKILDKLKTTGLDKKTIIVIVADHGEGFNEHGFFFHGQTLYNEAIHVPLVIHVPGWKAQTISHPVSIIDIAPTLLDLQNMKIPQVFQGESLVTSMIEGNNPLLKNRPIFAELLPYTAWKEHHKVAIIGDYKLIDLLSKGTKEFYDLKTDPKEKQNLIKETDKVKPLETALSNFISTQD